MITKTFENVKEDVSKDFQTKKFRIAVRPVSAVRHIHVDAVIIYSLHRRQLMGSGPWIELFLLFGCFKVLTRATVHLWFSWQFQLPNNDLVLHLHYDIFAHHLFFYFRKLHLSCMMRRKWVSQSNNLLRHMSKIDKPQSCWIFLILTMAAWQIKVSLFAVVKWVYEACC